MKVAMPILFPFGIAYSNRSLEFEIDLMLFQSLTKHNGQKVAVKVDLIKAPLLLEKDLSYGGWTISAWLANQYHNHFFSIENQWTLTIETNSDIRAIATEYSAPSDMEREFWCALAVLLQGALSIFGYTRIEPFIHLAEGEVLLNSRLSPMLNQSWFHDELGLKLIFHDDNYKIGKSVAKDYPILYPHLAESVQPLNWGRVCERESVIASNEVYHFGNVLAELIRQHPGTDYAPIIGLLTAFTEGLLKISGENTFKFSLKMANIFSDPKLMPVAKRIYGQRSTFFHNAIAARPTDIFEFATIEFMILAIRKIFMFGFDTKIDASSFDFPLPRQHG